MKAHRRRSRSPSPVPAQLTQHHIVAGAVPTSVDSPMRPTVSTSPQDGLNGSSNSLPPQRVTAKVTTPSAGIAMAKASSSQSMKAGSQQQQQQQQQVGFPGGAGLNAGAGAKLVPIDGASPRPKTSDSAAAKAALKPLDVDHLHSQIAVSSPLQPVREAQSNGNGAAPASPAKTPPRVKRLPALEKVRAESTAPEAPKSPLAQLGNIVRMASQRGKRLLRGVGKSKSRSMGTMSAKDRRRSSSALRKIRSAASMTKKGVHEMFSLNVSLRAVVVHKHTVWGSTREGNIKVYNADSGVEMNTVDVPPNTYVWCMVSVGRFVWCGTETGAILVYHGGTRKLVRKCKQHNGGIYAIITNRVMLMEDQHSLLALQHEMQSSKSLLSRVNNENVPEAQATRSPLKFKPSASNIREDVEEVKRVDSASQLDLAVGASASPHGKSPQPSFLTPYRLVWSGSADFTIVAWDAKGRFVQSYTGHTNNVRCLCIVGSHLWSGSDDSSIRVWNTNDRNSCLRVLTGHEGGVVSLAHVTRDVWKPDDHTRLDGHSRAQMYKKGGSVASGVSSSGMTGLLATAVVSGSTTGEIRVWNAVTYECMHVISGPQGRVASCVVMGDNQVWCGDAKGDIHILNSKDNFKTVKVLDSHSKFLSGMVSVQRRETRIVWSHSIGEASTKVWQQVFDLSDTVDPAEYLAEISQLQSRVVELEARAAADSVDRARELAKVELQLEDTQGELEQEKHAHANTREQLKAANVRAVADSLAAGTTKEAGCQTEFDMSAMAAKLAEAEARVAELEATIVKPAAGSGEEAQAKLQKELHTLTVAHKAMEVTLAETKQKLTKSEAELRTECRTSLKLQRRLDAMDENAMRMIQRDLDRAKVDLQHKILELDSLQAKYNSLDVFKLDKIARRMHDLRVDIQKVEMGLTNFELSGISNPGDRQAVKVMVKQALHDTSTAKRELAEVVEDCLTDTLKFHIGAPNTGSGSLAGADYQAIMAAGGTERYAAKHRRRSSQPKTREPDAMGEIQKEMLHAVDNNLKRRRSLSSPGFSRDEALGLPSSADFEM